MPGVVHMMRLDAQNLVKGLAKTLFQLLLFFSTEKCVLYERAIVCMYLF